jgi:hypothetical protein
MRFIKFFLLMIIVTISACGDKGSSQTNTGPASRSMNIQQGSLPFKIVGLNQSSQMYCSVFFETTNNSQNTLSMTLNGVFKTPQNQVIESTLRVIKVRGGQTVTDNILVEDQCGVIGSFTLTNTTTCEVDGQFVNDDVCWNQFNPQPGRIPVYK